MSVVTNLLLHIGISEEEDEQLKAINAFFTERAYPHEKPLVAMDTEEHHSWYGGTKHLECYLFVGAFNHFDLDGFIKHLKSLTWVASEDVQIILKEDNDTNFRIIDVFSGNSYDFYTSMEEKMLLGEADFFLEEIEQHQFVLDTSDKEFLQAWRQRYKDLQE